MFRYRPDILQALEAHGLAPDAATDPTLVRDFLDELYRFEIRRLRGRLLRREFPRHEYAARVRTLRNRYLLLGIPLHAWGDEDGR